MTEKVRTEKVMTKVLYSALAASMLLTACGVQAEAPEGSEEVEVKDVTVVLEGDERAGEAVDGLTPAERCAAAYEATEGRCEDARIFGLTECVDSFQELATCAIELPEGFCAESEAYMACLEGQVGGGERGEQGDVCAEAAEVTSPLCPEHDAVFTEFCEDESFAELIACAIEEPEGFCATSDGQRDASSRRYEACVERLRASSSQEPPEREPPVTSEAPEAIDLGIILSDKSDVDFTVDARGRAHIFFVDRHANDALMWAHQGADGSFELVKLAGNPDEAHQQGSYRNLRAHAGADGRVHLLYEPLVGANFSLVYLALDFVNGHDATILRSGVNLPLEMPLGAETFAVSSMPDGRAILAWSDWRGRLKFKIEGQQAVTVSEGLIDDLTDFELAPDMSGGAHLLVRLHSETPYYMHIDAQGRLIEEDILVLPGEGEYGKAELVSMPTGRPWITAWSPETDRFHFYEGPGRDSQDDTWGGWSLNDSEGMYRWGNGTVVSDRHGLVSVIEDARGRLVAYQLAPFPRGVDWEEELVLAPQANLSRYGSALDHEHIEAVAGPDGSIHVLSRVAMADAEHPAYVALRYSIIR